MAEPSETAVKTLFANSRNLCFFTACEEHLTDPTWRQVNGEIAHIKGDHPGSARYDANQSEKDRQGYDNLMLLCPKHHKLIDRLEPDAYPVERLVEIKDKHMLHAAARPWELDDRLLEFARAAVREYVTFSDSTRAARHLDLPTPVGRDLKLLWNTEANEETEIGTSGAIAPSGEVSMRVITGGDQNQDTDTAPDAPGPSDESATGLPQTAVQDPADVVIAGNQAVERDEAMSGDPQIAVRGTAPISAPTERAEDET